MLFYYDKITIVYNTSLNPAEEIYSRTNDNDDNNGNSNNETTIYKKEIEISDDENKKLPSKVQTTIVWRRKRDLNPRAGFPTYSLSRGAPSASWVFLHKILSCWFERNAVGDTAKGVSRGNRAIKKSPLWQISAQILRPLKVFPSKTLLV